MGVFDTIAAVLDGAGGLAAEGNVAGSQFEMDFSTLQDIQNDFTGGVAAQASTPAILPQPVGQRGYIDPIGPGLTDTSSTATHLIILAVLGLAVFYVLRRG